MRSRKGLRALLAATALGLAACGGMGGGSEGAPVDAQIVNRNGTVLQVLSLRAADERVLVNVRLMNGRDNEVSFSAGREASYILTDSGEKLLLIPAAGNERLSVPGGRSMDGALVFEGALPRSGTATLILNERGQPDSAYSNTPRFDVTLPLDNARGGGEIPTTSALSNLRANSPSSLRAATGAGSSLGAGGQGASNLQVVEALKSELGAVQTERGTLISLPGDVTFDFDRATLRQEARVTLDRLVELIQASNVTGAIAIEGHTDSRGEEGYNQRLSVQRAEAVRDYLVSRGIDAAALRPAGFGQTRPIAPNARPDGGDDEAGRQRNRRVEVVLPDAAPQGEATSSLRPAGGAEP